jgi:23S rRNA (adenine2030-N6)-methyltransferase
MTTPAGAEHEYAHVFHAGNVGDVLKHVVLAAVLQEATWAGPVTYIDTHSGEGLHQLRTTGEWTEGVFRFWRAPAKGPGLEPWMDVVRSFSPREDRPERYPGSPVLAAKLLDANAKLELFETSVEPVEGLRRHLADDARASIHASDGFAGLLPALQRHAGRRVVALIDPPYNAKEEWTKVVKAVVDASQAAPDATLLLWYPIKSWSRPHVLVRTLREAGVAATTLELITTPLEFKRNRLNGSGLLGVNLSDAFVDAIVPVLHQIGRRCATQQGQWSLHVGGWKKPVGE